MSHNSLTGQADFTKSVAAAAGRVLKVDAQTIGFDDFTAAGSPVDGAVLGLEVSGLVGTGESKTVLEVAPYTFTHVAEIPTMVPETN